MSEGRTNCGAEWYPMSSRLLRICYVYGCFACIMFVHHMCTYCPQRPEQGLRFPRTRARQLWAVTCMLGTEPRLSGEAASARLLCPVLNVLNTNVSGPQGPCRCLSVLWRALPSCLLRCLVHGVPPYKYTQAFDTVSRCYFPVGGDRASWRNGWSQTWGRGI